MNFTVKQQDDLINQLYKIVDEDNQNGIDQIELMDYLNVFSHIQVKEDGVKNILSLIDLDDHNYLDEQDFEVFMKSPVQYPFEIEEMLKLFLVFDTEKKGKVYWAQFKHYIKKFGSHFNPDSFLQYFGSEYLVDGKLDYASFWYNNFGYEVAHDGDLIDQKQHSYVEIDLQETQKRDAKGFTGSREESAIETEELSEADLAVLAFEEQNRSDLEDERLAEKERLDYEESEERRRREEGRNKKKEEREWKREEDRKKKEEEEKKRQEEERLRLEEEERLRLEEEEDLRLEQEELLKKSNVSQKKEEDRKKKEEDRKTKKAQDEAKKKQEERKKKRAEERKRKEELANMDPLERFRSLLHESDNWPLLQEYERECSKNKISWFGTQFKGKKKTEIYFENMQIGFDGQITGTGSDAEGKFMIEGEMNIFQNEAKGEITFTKTYNKTKKSVEYTGNLSNGMIKGVTQGDSIKQESFELRVLGNDWHGWKIPQTNIRQDYDLNFLMNKDFIFGIGTNIKGSYLIKGNFNHTADEVQFIVAYFDQTHQMHRGKTNRVNLKKKKSDVTIDGTWNMLGEDITEQEFGLKGFYGELKEQQLEPPQQKSPKKKTADTPAFKSPEPLRKVEEVKEEDKEEEEKHANIDDLGAAMLDKYILWTGSRVSTTDVNHSMKFYFDDFQIHPDLTCTGMGSDLLGDYVITGDVKLNDNKNGIITMIKTYAIDEIEFKSYYLQEKQQNFIEDVTSVVKYTGVIFENSIIKGKWEIIEGTGKGVEGTFELQCSGQQWVGDWTVEGKKKPLKMYLIVEKDFAYAVSSNEEHGGFYIMRGDNNVETQKIIFVQKYFGTNENIEFEGTAKRIKPDKEKSKVRMEGTYKNLKTGASGEFKIIGAYGQLASKKDVTKVAFASLLSPDQSLKSSAIQQLKTDPQKIISWAGRYEQNHKWTKMNFDNMQITIEGRVHGTGKDVVGKFEIEGVVDKDRVISFKKQYIGKHFLNYNGKIDEKWSITGTYSMPNNTSRGKFELQKTETVA